MVMVSVHSGAVSAAPSIRTLSVGTGSLQVTLEEDANGVGISSITVDGEETLHSSEFSEIFAMELSDGSETIRLEASGGWGLVTHTNDGTSCRLEWSQPLAVGASAGLNAVVTLNVAESRSQWTLEISGVGTWSLMDVEFPQLNISANGGDHLLVPRYSGILFPDPVAEGVDWSEIYPAGWHASMQFLSYYNSGYGLYFGFHDPDAVIKTFHAAAASGGLEIGASFPVPDRGVPGNDWQVPGVFELDAFEGDWYDAALIYRDWASSEAGFRPGDDPERAARLEEISAISLWGNFGGGYDPSVVESNTLEFAEYMGVPVGLTWYQWNYLYGDDNYPEYFPERTGMTDAVTALQAAGIRVVPYINGRLFDTDLDGTGPEGIDFETDGRPFAVKDADGNLMTQVFTGNLFAYMCPTQAHWQDFLVSASQRLTDTIGCAGLYIDQIGAASPVQCMDPSHGHSLGGGGWWSSGYDEMLGRINAADPEARFLTTESGVDAFVDDFEGFMVQGWQADGMVPAFQAVYADVVRLFGMKTGVSHYNDQQFYCKLSQAFAHGIQLGRFYTSIRNATGDEEKAPLFVRRIGRIHHKLREFFAGGRMVRPLAVTGAGTITTTWQYTYDGDIPVTISQVPTSSWSVDAAGRKAVALAFVNASMTDPANFSFDFDAADFGLTGDLYIQEIGENFESAVDQCPSTFSRNVALEPLDATVLVISNSDASLGSHLFRDGFDDGSTTAWSSVTVTR